MHYHKQDTIGPPLLPIKFKYVRQCSPRVSQWKYVAFDLLSMLHRALRARVMLTTWEDVMKIRPFESHTSKLSHVSYPFSACRALQMLIFWASTSAFHPRDSSCKRKGSRKARECPCQYCVLTGSRDPVSISNGVIWPRLVGCQC